MRTSRSSFAPVLLLAALVLLLVGCGDERKNRRPPARGPAAPPKVPDPVLENFELLGENPRWVPIQEVFAKYEAAQIEELANPLQSNLVTFVEKPIIERKERAPGDARPVLPVPKDKDAVKTDEDDPRRRFPLKEYKLIILMTGTARPKAVVISPMDERFELLRGDPIGKEGGRVRAVTQFNMLVAMPGKTVPVSVSLRPPLTKLDAGLAPEKQPKKAEF